MTQVALLYKNIVAVMQNLGHKVVAEGVETQEEIDLLKQWVLILYKDIIIQNH